MAFPLEMPQVPGNDLDWSIRLFIMRIYWLIHFESLFFLFWILCLYLLIVNLAQAQMEVERQCCANLLNERKYACFEHIKSRLFTLLLISGASEKNPSQPASRLLGFVLSNFLSYLQGMKMGIWLTYCHAVSAVATFWITGNSCKMN